MVFLNPAILFGLIAASIPVLIHLLNLRKLKKVEFSTLSFLKELQKTKIRKIKLKQWILLALRVLIILFLVLAFARPTLESVSFGVGSTAKTSAVIIVDNTFSLSAIDENGSLINQAKSAVGKLLNEFKDGDEITLIKSSSFTNPETTTNPDIAKKIIDDIGISYISSDLAGAVKKAYEILMVSQNFNKEIYIFSDFQRERFFRGDDLSSDYNASGIKFYYMPLAEKKLNNLSVSSLEIDNQIFELNKPIMIKSNITNYSASAFSNNVVSLFVNGNRSAQRSFDIQPGETVQIQFETTISSTGLLEIIVELEDDDILYDNKRFTDIYVPESIKTLILADRLNDALFVATALGENGSNYIKVTKDLSSRINAYNLFDYDAVILIGSDFTNNTQKISQFVESGGSIVIMPGSVPNGFDLLLNNLKLPRPDAYIESSNDEDFSSFEKLDLSHPVFTDLFENEKKQIESPRIYKYFKIFTGGKGKNVISQIGGSAFLSDYNIGDGKILLFSSSPVLSWSNFPVKGIFAPLINKTIFYLISANKTSYNYVAGQEITVQGSKAISPQVKVIKPDNSEELFQPELKGFNSTFNYTATEATGIYKFYSGNNLFDYVPVNFDNRESVPDYLNSAEIETLLSTYFKDSDFITLDKNSDISEKVTLARFGTELWKPLLVLVLLLALIEMWLAKSAKKDLVNF